MIWILAFIFLIIIIPIVIGYSISAPKYKGPVSDHFNGKQFLNKSGKSAQGIAEVVKWSFNREKEPWVRIQAAIKKANIPERANDDQVRITFINHSSFLIQISGLNILTDPVYSERVSPFQWIGPKRMRPPGVRFEDLPPIDYVIISHNHYDHLDENTVKKIKTAHDPVFIVPLGVSAFLKTLEINHVKEMDWWNNELLSESVNLTSVPAQHFSGRGLSDRDATLWCGYVIKTKGGNIYFAGDSGYDEGMFKEIGERMAPIKVSLIPIGAYLPKWFMSPIHISPREAVQVHKDVRSEQSIAIHFGTFPLADDGQDRPIKDLKAALNNKNISEEKFLVMDEGQSKEFFIGH